MEIALPSVLYCDSRLGEIDQWCIGDPNGLDMRLDDLIRNTIGYIVTKSNAGGVNYEREIGTGFFVSVPSEALLNRSYLYFIAARHVVFDKNGKLEPNLHIRTNFKDGIKRDIKILGEWHCPKNKDIDLAVLPVSNLRQEILDIAYIPYEPKGDRGEKKNAFADNKTIGEWNIGIGDEVRVVGLYVSQSGVKRIEPIVRAGILSALPENPVEVTQSGKTITFNAYLIEVRSLGGLSGSPVFALIEGDRKPLPDGSHILFGTGYRVFFVGNNTRSAQLQNI